MSSAAPKPTPRFNSIFKQLMSIHWWMAAFYLILLPSGKIMAELDREVSFRDLMYAAHKSLGVLVLLLLGWRVYLLLRVWGRKYRQHLPKFTSKWYFTTALHTLLYLMMWAVPMSGYWLSNSFHANSVNLFGLPMPDLFPVSRTALTQARSAHSNTSTIFFAIIVVHIICQQKVVKANWRRFVDQVHKWRSSSGSN
jgi:cytochrome b561